MTDFRTVSGSFSVAPQLEPGDMAEAAARGFALVINNRPDHEDGGQPDSATMEAAARAAGLDYVHIPVIGGPNAAQVEAVRQAVAEADGPVLAFCRSGTRSIVTWAKGQAADGADSEQLVTLGRGAGYDLSQVV